MKKFLHAKPESSALGSYFRWCHNQQREDEIIAAYLQAFAQLDRCGSIDAEVNYIVCDLLKCNPWELDEALNANDDELRIKIACM